jgi:hypothetical protein
VSRPYPACSRYPQGWRPAAAAWLLPCDISQRAEPDVRPLKPRGLCIYCGDDAPPATMLTDDVPSRHLMRPVLSAADGVRVILQTAHLSSLLSNSAPVPCSTLCSPSLVGEASPARRDYTRSQVSGRKKIAPAGDISGYIRYVSGPTCRGLALLYMPPLAIKVEACHVTRQAHLDLSDSR